MNCLVKLNLKTWSIILLIINMLSLVIRYNFMTEKFFTDSMHLMYIEQFGGIYDGSFTIAARFFNIINLFNINTLLEWSIYIGIIYFFINIFLVKNVTNIEFKKFIFLLLALVLTYLFEIGITKEVLQSIFYISIFTVCRLTSIKKSFYYLIIGSIILLSCSLFFREYYILTAIFSIGIYYILILIRQFNEKNNRAIFMFVFLILIMLTIFLLISSVVFPHEYSSIINLRTYRYQYLDGYTDSLIRDIISNQNNNVTIYIFNYILNCVRLLIPLELLIIGKVYYIPYIIYQTIFTYYYFGFIKKIQKTTTKDIVNFTFISSFVFVAVIMEPDFGSWARHQTVILPLIIECFIYDNIGEDKIE